MSRAEILEDTLARLEVERFAPLPPRPQAAPRCDPPFQLSREQQAENLRTLAEAIGAENDLPELPEGA